MQCRCAIQLRHPAFGHHTAEQAQAGETFGAREAYVALIRGKHARTVAKEQRGKHPVIAGPLEPHAFSAIAKRLDARRKRNHLIPGFRESFWGRIGANAAQELGIVVGNRVGGGIGKP